MPETNRTAEVANELSYRNGYDLCLAAEVSDFAEQEAEDERLEAEGRREMYEMLELSGY